MMIHKKTYSPLLLAGAAMLGANSAHAILPLGEGSEAFATLKGGVSYNDNLFLAESGEESTSIYEVTPGVQVLFGQNSLAQSSFTYTENFKFYGDNGDALDTSLSTVNATARYDDGKTKFDAAGNYQQLDQATRDVRNGPGLNEREVTTGNATVETRFSDKSAVRLGLTYSDTNYKSSAYTDFETFSIPIGYYYEVLPKLDASVGFKYKDNSLTGTGAADSSEYLYTVGARGDLAPKLTGEVQIGYHDFQADAGKDDSTVGVSSNLTYAISAKTTLTGGVSNDYSYSGSGDVQRIFGVNVGGSADISSQLKANAFLGYYKYSYFATGRKDDFIAGNLGLTYSYNQNVTISGTYSYTNNDSDTAGSTFTGNLFSLSASLRY